MERQTCAGTARAALTVRLQGKRVDRTSRPVAATLARSKVSRAGVVVHGPSLETRLLFFHRHLPSLKTATITLRPTSAAAAAAAAAARTSRSPGRLFGASRSEVTHKGESRAPLKRKP